MSLRSGTRCPLVGPRRPDRDEKRLTEISPTRRVPSHGTDLFATTYAFDIVAVDDGRTDPVRWSCSGTYFSGEDCVVLQTSEIRMQSSGGEVSSGRRTQSPIRVLKGRASAGDGTAVVALAHTDPPTSRTAVGLRSSGHAHHALLGDGRHQPAG